MLTLADLNECFEQAKQVGAKYIAVCVVVDSFKEEVIINQNENFEDKRVYYNRIYSEGLIHKFSLDVEIKITGFTYGDSFYDLEMSLEAMRLTGSLLN